MLRNPSAGPSTAPRSRKLTVQLEHWRDHHANPAMRDQLAEVLSEL